MTEEENAPGDGSAVSAHGVRVAYEGTEVLHGIDLDIAPGEVVALLGANGSGKTTLVKALLGVLPLTGGTVRLLGEPLGRTVAWSRIGYVPQRATAATGVPTTSREVVASGLLAGRRLRLPRDWRARSTAALDTVGLAGRARDNVSELSGGQQQRVLIARALVKDPRMLILDEPNTGLDAESQDALVRALQRGTGTGTGMGSASDRDPLTLIMVLHEIGPYAPLITRSVILRDGMVAEDRAASPMAHDPSHSLGDPHHAHPGPTPPHHRTPDLEWKP
ncbi:MAG: ATP-binding cassette domain-containing protein [Bifidobacteriaceae bacterium]|nr:ATP-binding cassette domain-containing protein [Bifidobacteriaceae bacterium]